MAAFNHFFNKRDQIIGEVNNQTIIQQVFLLVDQVLYVRDSPDQLLFMLEQII